MPLNSYNNNNKGPSVNVYTPMSFINPEKTPGRFTISYFNRVMQFAITNVVVGNGPDGFPRFDNNNQAKVFISFRQAKILHDGILAMLAKDSTVNNVCIETKNGLLKVTNGVEYGYENYTISITYQDQNKNFQESVYYFKGDKTLAYNYDKDSNSYDVMDFPKFELNTFLMILDEYYKASSYAVAASVREAGMYRDDGFYRTIHAIADKVGVPKESSNNQQYSSHTFLQNSAQYNGNAAGSTSGNYNGDGMQGVPKGYEQSSFDDIVNSMNPAESDD